LNNGSYVDGERGDIEGREDDLGDDDGRDLLMVKFRQPSHEFTFGVGMTFISYPLVLTPLV
jgi:hypothetical protein